MDMTDHKHISLPFDPYYWGATGTVWLHNRFIDKGQAPIFLRLADQTCRGLPNWLLPVLSSAGNGALESDNIQRTASEK